jgi:nitroreductase
MAEMGLFEAIHSARALRRFKPDPVPDDVLTKVLDAAIRAPSGSNAQNWLFVVVKDAATRRKIGDIYRKGGALIAKFYANRAPAAHMNEKQQARLMASAMHLMEHMGEVPVHLFACLRQEPAAPPANLTPEQQSAMRTVVRLSGSSIFPAVQNIILACRAFGLGTVLTTIHVFFEDEV